MGIPTQLACAVSAAAKVGKPVTVVTSEGKPRVIVPSFTVPNTSNSEENRDRMPCCSLVTRPAKRRP
jgi:hypothetical protein